MSVKKRIKNTKIGKKIIAHRDRKLITRFCRTARNQGYQYIFSVIIPIYNAEKYLEECINSVILQTVGFANIQIILVNDGSSDDSEGICKRYCERYPENIVLYSQKNAGVSAARNTGLEHVKGMYVSFLDSDDKWSRKAFLQLLGFFRDFGAVDIVAVKEKFFDARKGDHPRNHAFKKDRIVDLEREPDVLPVTSPQVIIKSSSIGEVRFDEKLLHSEDALFTTEILFNVDSFGIAAEPVYYYRKRTDSTSTVDTIEAKKHYYSEALELYHNHIIEESKKRFGIVKKYVQYELAYNIGWRIKVGLPEILNEKELRDYRKKLKDIFQDIDDDIIAQQKSFELHHRVYMIALKYNINYADAVSNLSAGEDDKINVDLADGQHCAGMIEKNFSSCIIQFLTVEKESGELCIEGRLDRCRILPGQVSLEWNCNEKTYNSDIYMRKHGPMKFVFDEPAAYQLHFRVRIPLEKHMKLTCKLTMLGKEFEKVKMKYGVFAGLSGVYKNSAYCVKEGRLFYLEDGILNLVEGPISDERISELEKRYLADICKRKKGEYWAEFRKKAFEARGKKSRLWLFCDRMTSAEDSAEELFRYVNENPVEGVETAFIIRADSPDYERLRALGRVIPFDSDEHYSAMLEADKVISSAADAAVIQPFGKGHRFVKDLMHFDFIFLQHGVIKDDLSGWLHRGSKNIKLFVTSAERERDAILNDDYGYDEKQVILTGLPRFDTLERNSETAEENSIYIMPTWRQWIAPSYDLRAENFDDIAKSKDNFKDSDYFKFYNGLLSDSRLHELIEKYDYNIYFALHPRMGAEMNSFYSDERIHLLMPESFVYSEAFKKMKMLVTDYSSIAFNIGILKKPVIYAQFDYDEFYNSGKHTSKAGYFSFENDGFGPVVYSKDAVIEEIAEKLRNGMEIEKKYEQRIENFFFYPPKGKTRSELIVEHILEFFKTLI